MVMLNQGHYRASTGSSSTSKKKTTSSSSSSNSTLRVGSRGEDVKVLQRKLGITADGIFGNQTASAVKSYQRKNGLSADGIVGKNTWGKLNSTSTPKNVTREAPYVAPKPKPKPKPTTNARQELLGIKPTTVIQPKPVTPKKPPVNTVMRQKPTTISARDSFLLGMGGKEQKIAPVNLTPRQQLLTGATNVPRVTMQPKSPTSKPTPTASIMPVGKPTPISVPSSKPTTSTTNRPTAPLKNVPQGQGTTRSIMPVTSSAPSPVAQTPNYTNQINSVQQQYQGVQNQVKQQQQKLDTNYQNTVNQYKQQNQQATNQYNQQKSQYATQQNQAQNNYQNQLNQIQQQGQSLTNNYNQQMSQANQQGQQIRDSYNNSEARTNNENMMNATIDDIASKYGFDFSREYANRQAETQAQAKRNAYNDSIRKNETQNEELLQQIDNNVRESNTALDHSYFQQMLGQQQSQVNSGINGGIAADQNLRLAMSKQGQLADVYKDANLGRMQENNRFTNESTRLSEALSLVEQQKMAQSEQLFQNLRMQGYDILGQDKNWARQLDRDARSDMQFDLGQNENSIDRLRDNYEFDYGMNRQTSRDTRSDFESDRGFNYQQGRDAYEDYTDLLDRNRQTSRDSRSDYEFDTGMNRQTGRDARGDMEFDLNRMTDQEKFAWNKLMDEAGLTGMFNGQKTWQRQLQEAELALSRQRASNPGGGSRSTYSVPKQTQATTNQLVNEFRNSIPSKNQKLDNYYTSSENTLKKANETYQNRPYVNSIFKPVSPYDNPALDPYQKLRLLRG
jgi:hypothetical protein